jgi:hypothetical protein
MANGRHPAPQVQLLQRRANAKDHSTHLIAQAFDFIRIGSAPEALGEVEEFLLFALLSLHAVLYAPKWCGRVWGESWVKMTRRRGFQMQPGIPDFRFTEYSLGGSVLRPVCAQTTQTTKSDRLRHQSL